MRDLKAEAKAHFAEAGDVKKTGADEFIEQVVPLFRLVGSEFIYVGDDPSFAGLTYEQVLGELRTLKPHLFSGASNDLRNASFGTEPTLKARSALIQKVGEAEYYRIAREWGSDGISLKPGKRPDVSSSHDGDKSPEGNARSNNPWAAANWNITAQGRIVAGLGAEKAAQIAKAAGSFIGATRPTR